MYKNFKIYKIFTAKHLEMYTACTSMKKINTQCLIYTKKKISRRLRSMKTLVFDIL